MNLDEIIKKTNNFKKIAINPSIISQNNQTLNDTLKSLFKNLQQRSTIIPSSQDKNADLIAMHSKMQNHDIDELNQLLFAAAGLSAAWNDAELIENNKKIWFKEIYPKADYLHNLVMKQIQNLKEWQESNSDLKKQSQNFTKEYMTHKNNSLLKKVDFFEKLAVYGDRSDFLKSLSQDIGYTAGPGMVEVPSNQFVAQEDIDRSTLGPGLTTFPVMNEKVNNKPIPRPALKHYNLIPENGFINPKVQQSLKILYPQVKIDVDSKFGPQTRGAMNQYKIDYHDERDLADPELQANIIADADAKRLHSGLDEALKTSSVKIPLFEKLAQETVKKKDLTPYNLIKNSEGIIKLPDVITRSNYKEDLKEELKEVQQALNRLGYSLGPTGVDGMWGKYTREAIEDWCKKNDRDPNYPKLAFDAIIEAGEKTIKTPYHVIENNIENKNIPTTSLENLNKAITLTNRIKAQVDRLTRDATFANFLDVKGNEQLKQMIEAVKNTEINNSNLYPMYHYITNLSKNLSQETQIPAAKQLSDYLNGQLIMIYDALSNK